MHVTDAIILFILSALSGMGVGSGGLPTLLFLWKMGYAQLSAQGLNLFCFLCSAGSSLLTQIKRRIPFLRIYLLLVSGIPGSFFGCILASSVDSGISRRIFGLFLIFSGVLSQFSVFGRQMRTNTSGKSDSHSQE